MDKKRLLLATLLASALAAPAAYSERSGGVDVGSPVSGTYENGSADIGGAISQTINTQVSNAIFKNNVANGNYLKTDPVDYKGGGAIFFNGTDKTINISGSTFEGNKTIGTYSMGGALYLYSGKAIIDGTTFDSNKAVYGGAIYTRNKTAVSDLQISNSQFINNEAEGVGAAAIIRNATISNTLFQGNKATADEDGAGALFLGSESITSISGTTKFDSNTSFARGGAISTRGTVADGKISENNSGAKLDISNATFVGNKAGTIGGAIDNTFYNSEAKSGFVTVKDSTFDANSAAMGGAIYNHGEKDKKGAGSAAAMYIDGGSFTSNKSTGRGGAIYNEGTLTIKDAEFDSNSTSTGDGGAIFVNGGVVNISNTTFENNTALNSGADSGAVSVRLGDVTISDSTFEGNKADIGGAIYQYAQPTAKLTLNNVDFTSNEASAIGALGIYSTTSVTGGKFTSNKANGPDSDGSGAIFVGAVGKAAISEGVEFISNTSAAGGGAIGSRSFADGDNHGATLDISNAKFSQNRAATNGGAINNYLYNDANNDGYVKITGTKFTLNSAANGGAIYNNIGADGDKKYAGNQQVGNIYVANSTFENNSATTNGGAIYNEGTLTLAGTNTFSGNKVNDVANDIYNAGTLNISGNTTFDGGIDGASGIVGITGADTVVGISTIKNQTVSVNGGTLKLSSDLSDGSNLSGSSVSVASGAIIDTIDNLINDYTGKITLSNGAVIKGDINYVAGTADTYAASEGATVKYSIGNLIGDIGGTDKTIQVVSSGATVDISEAHFNSENGLTFFSSGAADGKMIVKGIAGGINGAVEKTDDGTPIDISYNVTSDETFKVEANDTDRTIEHSNFVIDGNNKSITAADGAKGIIVANNSTLTANKVVFSAFDEDNNGAIENHGVLNINNSRFASDNATAIYNHAGATLVSDPTYYEAKVINEGSASFDGDEFLNIADGSALKNTAAATTTLTNTDFTNNSAANGGAIYNDSTATPIAVTITGGVFTKNSATSAGGAIYNTAAMSISGATFGGTSVGNSAGTHGGAIYNSGNLTITDTSFDSNAATGLGGAIYSTADLSINAASSAVAFTNNTDGSGNNDIYMLGTSGSPVSLALNAADTTKTITLGGGINGQYYNVNINTASGNVGTVALGTVAGAKDMIISAGDVSAASVDADSLALNGGTFDITTNASAIDALSTVAGTTLNTDAKLTVLTGANAGTIDGNGLLVVGNGDSTAQTFANSGLIKNAIEIKVNDKLTTVGVDNLTTPTKGVTKTINNAGILSVTSDNISADITGAGLLETADGVVIADGVSVEQGSLNVAGTLTNSGSGLTVNGDIADGGSGTIVGAGDISLKGGTSDSAMSTNAVVINTTGDVSIDGFVNNTGSITANDISIANGKMLKTSADNISDTHDELIANDGTLKLTAGTLMNSIDASTSGKTVIDGSVIFGYDGGNTQVKQAIEINSGKDLTSSVSVLKGDVKNDGTLNVFSTDYSSLTANVSGDGNTVITRNTTIDSNVETAISIADYGTNHADVIVKSGRNFGKSGKAISVAALNNLTMESATDLKSAVDNDGILTLKSGTLSKDVTGDGSTNIDSTATVTNEASIGQDVYVVAGILDNLAAGTITGALSNFGIVTNSGDIQGNIINNIGASITSDASKIATGSSSTISNAGTLDITAGTISKAIGGVTIGSDTTYGKLKTADGVGIDGGVTVVQDVLDVTGTLNNAGDVTVNTTLTNGGTIANNGDLKLYGSDMTNAGTINGVGTTTIGNGTDNAKVTNSGSITGNDIIVATNALFVTDADKVSDKNSSIQNDGTVELAGGTASSYVASANALTGAGKTVISGYVDQSASIASTSTDADAIKVTGGLKIDAGNLDAKTTNDGALELTGGQLDNSIIGDGSTSITGAVVNASTIAQATGGISITGSGSLTTNAGDVTAAITNEVENGLVLTGGTNSNTISMTGSAGSTKIDSTSTVTNEASIGQDVNVVAGIFDNTTGSVSGKTTISSGATAKQSGTGSLGDVVNEGNLEISDGTVASVSNTATGSQGVTQSGGQVTGDVSNSGNYSISGGSIDGAVANTGTFNITGGTIGAYTQTAGETNISNGASLNLATAASSITGGNVTLGDSLNTAGSLIVDNGLTTNTAQVVTVGTGANVLTIGGTNDSKLALTGNSEIAKAAAVTISSGSTLDINSTSANGVVLNGTGTSVDTWAGTVNQTGGVLHVEGYDNASNKNGVIAVSSGELDVDGGVLTVGTGSSIESGDTAAKVVIAGGSTMDITSGGNVTLDGGSDLSRVDWQGNVTLNGGSLVLKNIHDASRDTVSNNKTGVLNAQTGDLNIDNSTVLLGNNDVIAQAVKLTLNGNIAVTNSADATIDSATDNWTSGNITQSGGTLTLSNVSTDTGKTLVSDNGILNVVDTVSLTTASDTIGANTTVNIAQGNTLDIQNSSVAGVTINSGDTWDGTIALSGGNLTIDTISKATTADAIFTQTGGSLTLDNAASLTLGTADSYITSGNVNIKNGSGLTIDNALANNSAVITSDSNASNALTVGGTTNASALELKSGSNIDKDTSLTVTSKGTLTAYGNSIKGGSTKGITNDGVFNLSNDGATAGTIARAITATDTANGTVNLLGNTESTSDGTINQANIKVGNGSGAAGSNTSVFTMGADVTANTLLEIAQDGKIVNAANNIVAESINVVAGASIVGDGSTEGNLTVKNGGTSSGNISQRDITLQGGTFSNTSTMTSANNFTNHATVTGAGTLTVKNGSSDGTITQDNITVSGNFDNDADMTANVLLANSGNIDNDAKITAKSLTNTGTITSTNGTGDLEVGTDGGTSSGNISQRNITLQGGTFSNTSTMTSANNFTNHATVTGAGTLTVKDGSSDGTISQKNITISGDFDNDANMTATTSLTNSGNIDNDAKITAKSLTNTGTITSTSGTGDLEVGTDGGTSSGNISQRNITLQGGTFSNTSTMTSANNFTNHATVTGAGTLTVKDGSSDGTISQNNITISGDFVNDANMTATTSLTNSGNIDNDAKITAKSLTNTGTITSTNGTGDLEVGTDGGTSSGNISQRNITLQGGTFSNTSTMTSANNFENHATVTGAGTLTVKNGSSDGTITQNNITVSGNFDNDADMTANVLLKNSGNIDNSAIITAARLENDNIIRDSAASMTGQLKVGGGYNGGAITQNLVQVTGGTFTNNESKTIDATTFHNTAAATYINKGIMGSTTPITDIYNEGIFTNETTGDIHVATLNNTNSMTNKNDITATDVINSATFNNTEGADLLAGTITNTAGTFKNDGSVGSTTAPVTTITNYAAGTFENNKNVYAGGIVNNGTFNNNAAGIIDADTVDNVAGTITNKGDIGAANDKVTTINNYDGATFDNQKNVYAGALNNAGILTNTGLSSSITADVVNNLATGSLTNEGTISATNTINRNTFDNEAGSTLLSSTIDNIAGTFTNKGDVGSSTTPVETLVNYDGATFDNQKNVYATSLNNNGTFTNTGSDSSIIATNVNNIAGTMSNEGTVTTDNAWNNATLTNDGLFTSNSTFVNDSVVDNTAEGLGTLSVNNGANNGTMTQGIVNIATGNVGFDNNDTMNVETALNNAGTFNNNADVYVANTTNNANLNNSGVINSNADSTITADTLTNTGGVMNLTKSQVAIVYQADDIMGTINVLGSDSSNDVTDLSITGSVPNFAGNLNVGNEANKATLNLNAGNVVEDAIANIAKGSVLNIDDSAAVAAGVGSSSVVLNSDDTFAGDVKLASGEVTMKDVNYSTGNTSTTAGGSNPYYEQTGGNLNLENATLSMEDASKISGGDMHVDSTSHFVSQSGAFNVGTLQNSGTVHSINSGYENHTFDNFVVGHPTNGDIQGDFTIDLYARSNNNKKYDQFGKDSTLISAADPSLKGTVHVADWSIGGDIFGHDAPIDRNIKLSHLFKGSVADGHEINFTSTDKEVFTPIGWYKLNSEGGGNYSFDMVRFNPQVFRGQITKIAQYQNQLAIDDMIFNHTMLDQGFKGNDYITSNPNRYASANDLYAPYQYSRKDGGLWVKTYANFEKLNMNHGLNVGNNAYGTIIGADFGLKNLRNGWQFMPTAYIGYNGAHQYWNGVGAYQNGGQLGFLGTWYKKDFMVGAMAYAGLYGNNMDTPRGHEDTLNYFAGGSVKTAYNWRFAKDWSLQPNLLVAYNFFGQENWHTDFGQMGMMAGMLHGINVAPGLNLIWEKETFSIYGTIQYMYNVNQSVGGRAGNVGLPNVHMDRGYLQYGLGINKKFSDRFSGYFQTVIRNVGRNGVGLQLGFNWQLGGGSKKSSQNAKKTVLKSMK